MSILFVNGELDIDMVMAKSRRKQVDVCTMYQKQI